MQDKPAEGNIGKKKKELGETWQTQLALHTLETV